MIKAAKNNGKIYVIQPDDRTPVNNTETVFDSRNAKAPGRFEVGKEVIVNIIRGVFFLLFLYAATSKLLEYDRFQLQLSKSPILTDFAGILAWLVPVLEIASSILLIFPRTILTGLYTSFSLMVMFTAYIIAILNFSSFIPCSCGGIFETMDWGEHLVFNISLVFLATTGAFLKQC